MNTSVLRTASRHLSANRLGTAGRPASLRAAARGYATFNWEDPLAASELYTEEELAIQETARQYCQEQLQPRVLGGFLLHSFISTHAPLVLEKKTKLFYRRLPT